MINLRLLGFYRMDGLLAYLFFMGALSVLTALLSYFSFHKKKAVPGARTFGLLLLSMTIWSFFYLLEIILSTLPAKILARKILYLGMTLSTAFWLIFALRHTTYGEAWNKRGYLALLTLPGWVMFLLGCTNDAHHLIWTSMKMPAYGALGGLQLSYGALFWAYTAVSYFFILTGFFIYLHLHLRLPAYFRRRTTATLMGAAAAFLVNALFLFGGTPLELDPTPLSFAVSAPLLAWGFFRFGVPKNYPISAPQVIERLRDAVLILDERHWLININQMARVWFGLGDTHIGEPIFTALPETAAFKDHWEAEDARFKFAYETEKGRAWYEVSVTPLCRQDETLMGRVLVIHDITQEHELLEAEIRHSAQMGLLQDIGRQVSDTLSEAGIFSRAVNALVNHFGYAEAAISLLLDNDNLELVAINGAQDFGYRPSFRQKMGEGIIGHVAETRQPYLCSHVTRDPYYFSLGEHYGSVIAVPLLNEAALLGVWYVESASAEAFTEEDAKTLETLASQIVSAAQRARLYAVSQEHLRVMSAVQSISQVVSSSLDLETVCDSLVQVLSEFFGYAYISIFLLEGKFLKLGGQAGYDLQTLPDKIRLSEGVCGRAARTRETQFIQDVSSEPVFLRFSPQVTSEICAPLLKENEVLGVLNVEGTKHNPLTQGDAHLLNRLSSAVSLAVNNAQLHAQVKTQARTDAVTGLFNRHVFEQTLKTEVERARRAHDPLSMLIFDVDSFKVYNDTYGHPAGDARLKAVAQLVKRSLRNYDIAARYGGDEFAVILPNSDHVGALLFAKRLLDSARKSAPKPLLDSAAGYTLSIGVGTFPEHGKSAAALLHSADHAELAAKQGGKNRVVSANEMKKDFHAAP